MRIYGPNGTTLGTPASNARRTSSTGFSLPDTTAVPDEVRSAAAPKAAGNIDALLALQGVEDPVERRKRSVARGKGALDVLDELKIGLLSGNLDASTVSRLRDAAANLKSSSGDPGLDLVLSEIELRVEVELAKAGRPNDLLSTGNAAQLDFLSPSALFLEGERTGKFRLGTVQLLTAEDGKSWISFEDFAVALADEIERPADIRQRFTVG